MMVYKLAEKIDNIQSIKIFDNKLFYVKNNQLFLNGKMIFKDIEPQSFWIKNNYLFFHNTEGGYCLVDNQKNLLKIISYSPFLFTVNNNVVYASYDYKFSNSVFNWKIGLFDITNDKNIKAIPNLFNCNFISKYNNYLIGYNAKGNLSVFSMQDNHSLWQLDLNQLGTFKNHFGETQEHKVEKIIGIYNEHLYVALSGRLLLELDIKTGEITHRWEAPSVSSLSNGKLIAIAGNIYTSIDLKTKAFTKKDFSNELAKLDLVSVRSNSYQHTDTHIFAIANLDLNKLNLNWFKEAIIAFNYQTQQIDWHYTNDTFSTGTATPKLGANKLYQLDINGNLYIFEKTTNETT